LDDSSTMPVMGTSNVTGWMARNQARCVGEEEEEEEEAESVGERREETKSERASEARVYANVIAIIPRIGTTIPLTCTKSRRECSRALWSFPR
jgi:hypothetical protein